MLNALMRMKQKINKKKIYFLSHIMELIILNWLHYLYFSIHNMYIVNVNNFYEMGTIHFNFYKIYNNNKKALKNCL